MPPPAVAAATQFPSPVPNPPEHFEFRRPDLLRHDQRVTFYFRTSVLRDIRDMLRHIGGDDLFRRFRQSVMGRFMVIRRRQSANMALHYLVARELTTPKGMSELIPTHERWFFVSGRIIRFTPAAFCLITGLAFGGSDFDNRARHELSDTSLYKKYFNRPTKADELLKVFNDKNLGTDPNDYLKAANLLVFYFFLFCRDRPPVEQWLWALVEDPNRWEAYPWGAYTYLNLIYYIRNVATARNQLSRPSNHYYGAWWAFQIWSYEAIAQLGAICGERDTVPTFPRFRMWVTDQSKAEFSTFFERPRLRLTEVLEPMPSEERQYAWQSLQSGNPFGVHFEPPVRLGQPVVEHTLTAWPEPSRAARPQKNKRKVKDPDFTTRLKEVAKKLKRRDVGVANSSHELRSKMNQNRPQLKRRRESSSSGSRSSSSSLICCLHGRPCRHRGMEDRYMRHLDNHLDRMMDQMMRLLGPRVQTGRPIPEWDAFDQRGPTPRQSVHDEPSPQFAHHSATSRQSFHREIARESLHEVIPQPSPQYAHRSSSTTRQPFHGDRPQPSRRSSTHSARRYSSGARQSFHGEEVETVVYQRKPRPTRQTVETPVVQDLEPLLDVAATPLVHTTVGGDGGGGRDDSPDSAATHSSFLARLLLELNSMSSC